MHGKLIPLYPEFAISLLSDSDGLSQTRKVSNLAVRGTVETGITFFHPEKEICMSLKQMIAETLPNDRHYHVPIRPIAEVWDECEVREKPPEEISLLEINGVTIGTAGNYSMIVGKKKSRKTLFLVWLAAKCNHAVMIFDTEQGKQH